MVRPQAPGRPEFRSRRRQNQEGRLRAAIAERTHEIDRGRVEPLQVLKDENKRLCSRAGDRPSDHRRQLPAVNLIRRKAWQAFKRNRNVDERRDQRRMLRGVELDVLEDQFELGEPPLRRNLGTAKPSPSPAQDRMQRRILQELRRTPFDPRVWRSRRAALETLRPAGTCRCRARRQSTRIALRPRGRVPSGGPGRRCPLRGR